jgi:hypothetical protein
LQGPRSPTIDSVDSVAPRAGRRKGVDGGPLGAFIGRVLMAITARNHRGGVTPAVSIDREEGRGNRGEDGADMRGPHISEGERGQGYWFGILAKWATGSFQFWAERFPGSISIFISSFLFFLFLISDLNQNLCNLDSKHFKQLLSYSDNQHSVLNQ